MAGVLKVLVAPDTWVPVGGQGPPGITMHTGPSAPADPDIDLWWDTDEVALNTMGTRTTWASPIASGITIGSGAVTSYYSRIGDTVTVAFSFQFGAGSAITGNTVLNLPFSYLSLITMSATLLDSGAAWYGAVVHPTAPNQIVVAALNTSTTYGAYGVLSSTVPYTWAAGDAVILAGSYFAA